MCVFKQTLIMHYFMCTCVHTYPPQHRPLKAKFSCKSKNDRQSGCSESSVPRKGIPLSSPDVVLIKKEKKRVNSFQLIIQITNVLENRYIKKGGKKKAANKITQFAQNLREKQLILETIR